MTNVLSSIAFVLALTSVAVAAEAKTEASAPVANQEVAATATPVEGADASKEAAAPATTEAAK